MQKKPKTPLEVWEGLLFKLLQLFKLLKKGHKKKDVRKVSSVRARARGRLGKWVWRCVGAYESATFFFFQKKKTKEKTFGPKCFYFFLFFCF